MRRISLVLADDPDHLEWIEAFKDNLISGTYADSLVILYPEDSNENLVRVMCYENNISTLRVPLNTERYSEALAYRRRSRWVLDLLIGAREHGASIDVKMFTNTINPSDFELKDFLGYCYVLEIPVTQYLSNGGFIYDP